MAKLIKTMQLDEEVELRDHGIVFEEGVPLEAMDPSDLVKIPWQEYLVRKNYNKDIHKMCEICIAEQKAKFNGRTPIICNGLNDYSTVLKKQYGDEMFDELRSNLTEEEIDELKSLFNPAEWFSQHMTDPRKAQERWTQTMVLSCSAKNKCVRMGRRCIAEDSEVLMANGTNKRIQDVKVGDEVLSYRDAVWAKNRVTATLDKGISDVVYRITTEAKAVVDVTKDHSLLTDNGWLSIEEGLTEGSNIYISGVIEQDIQETLLDSQVKLLGYMITDGYIGGVGQTPKFTSNTYQYIQEVSDICQELFGHPGIIKPRADSRAYDIWLTDGNRGTKNSAALWFTSLGINNPKYKYRNITTLLAKMTDRQVGLFLNRMWAGGGCISLSSNTKRPNGHRVEAALVTADYGVARAVNNALHKLGVLSRVSSEKPRKSETKSGKIIKTQEVFKVRLSSKNAISTFLNSVGFTFGKESQSKKAAAAVQCRGMKRRKPLNLKAVPSLSAITKIEKLNKPIRVFDLSVENDHNFIADGVVVHNCGKTYSIIMGLLYEIANADYPINILVAAPQVTMINEIAQTLEELVLLLDIPNMISRKKAQPILEIHFHNGSVLKGITAGADGTSARGKKADILWLDEVDFIPTKALDAIRAIQLDNPDVRLIYTSTPIGQGNMYSFAKQESTKEFHYPTFTRPDYTDEMHDTTKGLSDVAYAQEILSIYGVDEAGVFQAKYVDRSLDIFLEHHYNESFVINNRQNFLVFIGVDWNHDNNGTRVIVVAYDKEHDKFFKVEGHKIAKMQMTQALAVDTIVEMNRKYNADHIICDEGFGTAQVSQLRLKGQEQYGKVAPGHPDLKLTAVDSIQFGASLTITDPVTHKEIKKNTKQYMVEFVQKLLEDGRLSLHAIRDDELMTQMKNYHVASSGLRGNIYKPRDKKIGDHDLDAYMLALYGFDMYYGKFIKKQSIEYGNIMPKDYKYEVNPRDLMPTVASPLRSGFRSGRSSRGGYKPRRSLW